jgi:tRNA(Ile2) C34 agmatinyltransferase TiaS
MSNDVTTPAELRGLARGAAQRIVAAQVRRGQRCPSCGGTKTESNETTEFRCIDCDHRWGFDHGEQYGF